MIFSTARDVDIVKAALTSKWNWFTKTHFIYVMKGVKTLKMISTSVIIVFSNACADACEWVSILNVLTFQKHHIHNIIKKWLWCKEISKLGKRGNHACVLDIHSISLFKYEYFNDLNIHGRQMSGNSTMKSIQYYSMIVLSPQNHPWFRQIHPRIRQLHPYWHWHKWKPPSTNKIMLYYKIFFYIVIMFWFICSEYFLKLKKSASQST